MLERPGVELIGYSDRLSVAPGEAIRFMISTERLEYESALVRLIHGDTNPNGPGFKEEVFPGVLDGHHRGERQETRTGSYVLVENGDSLRVGSFTLQAWIMPTLPNRGRWQALLSRWSSNTHRGYGMFLDPDGYLTLMLGAPGTVERVRAGTRLCRDEWQFVAATFDHEAGAACVHQSPVSRWSRVELTSISERVDIDTASCSEVTAAFCIGAAGDLVASRHYVADAFDGKIDRPRVFARSLASAELERLARGEDPAEVAAGVVLAEWDFSAEQGSTSIQDVGPHRFDGSAVNMPTRGVTGHNWSGAETDFRLRPNEYGAIHFHSDDLEDAGWRPSIEWTVPTGVRSGVYALRLRAGDSEDHIPFVIRPSVGESHARVALLLPTLTYLAYANERMGDPMQPNSPFDWPSAWDPLDHYLDAHPELGKSLYDVHDDFSGVCYSSALRPIVSLRPKYRFRFLHAPRHLAGDLYLTDWLEHVDVEYDVLTDGDLHEEGQALLEGYAVLITGGHPEYWTANMIEAVEAWVGTGGRLMYLGGNGCYWVTSVHTERPHVIEVRRGYAGSRGWESEPGELHHSTTGELGGLWRYRGKLPNRLLGVGFAAEGADGQSIGYRRTHASYEEAVSWVFEGVEQEAFGSHGLVMGGAAGDELDRADRFLGTPPEAIVLATADGFGDAYDIPVEDDVRWRGRRRRGEVRADVVLTRNASGGAVFSVSSISWAGALSHDRYQNDVARISGNVLRGFMTPAGAGA
ncbi:MAG TPA: N,N-dimethylformamidase beta subunit family domain-containing protein [Solirubrobacteraceae bacterium]|nr:N,N-dimethylformamidase beta subunit family domain-containing protein [Solirubrobacteraceae bacterium]